MKKATAGMTRQTAKPYVSFYVDDAMQGRKITSTDDLSKCWLIGWQVGFEPLFVAVCSYLEGVSLTAEEAEELAKAYLEERKWFSDEPTDADYAFAPAKKDDVNAAVSCWDSLVELADKSKDDEDLQSAIDLLAQILNGGLAQYIENGYEPALPAAKRFLSACGEKNKGLVAVLNDQVVRSAIRKLQSASEGDYAIIVDQFEPVDNFVYDNIESLCKEIVDFVGDE